MKSLHLCYVGPGDSITTRRWAGWFAERGHRITILTVEPAEEPLPAGFRQVDLRTSGGSRKLGRLLSAVQLARHVRRLKPDLVHVHYAKGLAWGMVAVRHVPLVVTPWGSDVLEEQGAFKEWYSGPLTRALLRKADLVTVHSSFMEAAVRLLGRTGAMARIGWGVDVTRFRPGLDVNGLRERWQIPADAVVIFSPRIARPFYNLDRIIQAFAAVRKRVPKAWLVLAEPFADRAYVARLRGLADELGLRDRVRFVGALPYGDMPLWLNLAALSVMVPRSDGMPNSLWEAMACGAVPVLNRLPQYAELITDGENGWFAGPTPNELAETLVSALADPSERDRMARRNREIVLARGHQDREMDAMERWYETLAEGGTAPAPVEANQGKDAQLPCAGSPGSLS